jgi:hypothetical protein
MRDHFSSGGNAPIVQGRVLSPFSFTPQQAAGMLPVPTPESTSPTAFETSPRAPSLSPRAVCQSSASAPSASTAWCGRIPGPSRGLVRWPCPRGPRHAHPAKAERCFIFLPPVCRHGLPRRVVVPATTCGCIAPTKGSFEDLFQHGLEVRLRTQVMITILYRMKLDFHFQFQATLLQSLARMEVNLLILGSVD